jgi:phage-related holin
MWTIYSSPREVAFRMREDLSSLFYAFWLKLLAALVLAGAFTRYIGGEPGLLEIYVAVFTLDLVMGVVRALKTKSFRIALLGMWVIKLLTHFMCLTLVGLMWKASEFVFGSFPVLVNYFLFVMILTEAVSIVDNAARAGLPVPPMLSFMLVKLKRKGIKTLNQIVSDKPMTDEEADKAADGEKNEDGEKGRE